MKPRRTAAELDELFETKTKPWRFHKTKTALQRGLEERSAAVAQWWVFNVERKMLYLCMLLSILDCFVVIVFTLDFSAHSQVWPSIISSDHVWNLKWGKLTSINCVSSPDCLHSSLNIPSFWINSQGVPNSTTSPWSSTKILSLVSSLPNVVMRLTYPAPQRWEVDGQWQAFEYPSILFSRHFG